MGVKLRAFGLLVAGAAVAVPVSAQSASEIVSRMMDEYADRTARVDDYTIVQDAMGMETRAYFEKVTVEGRPTFQLRRSQAGGMSLNGPSQNFDEIYTFGSDLAEQARYEGTERIDNYDVHVLAIDDLSEIDFGSDMAAGPDSEFVPRSGKVFVDIDTFVPRRMEYEGEMTNSDGTHTVTSIITMGDYREIEGMLFPFRTEVRIEGLAAAIDPETRAQFEEMQRELENLPENQRAMVEAMMADQLEQFRAMMEGEDSGMSVTMLVREVLVNQGPPGD